MQLFNIITGNHVRKMGIMNGLYKDIIKASNLYIIVPAEGRNEGSKLQQSRISIDTLRSTSPIGGDAPVLGTA